MINDPRQLQCPGMRYTVQSGDTFFNIAGRYGITVQSLVNANPQIADPSRIVPGQVICIPVWPAPESIGNFNTYIGTININGQQLSAILSRSAPFEQEPTWAGTRVIAENPFTAINSSVIIAPFNIQTGARGNPILGGMVADCRS